MRLATIATFVLTLSACASPLKVTRISETPIDSSSRELVMLSNTPWDNSLRVALAKKRFAIKKFASAGVVKETIKTESRESSITANMANARYALTMSGTERDNCIVNDSVKLHASLEISDIKTNEVIAVIEKSEWTGSCGLTAVSGPFLFEQIADAVDSLWKDKRAPASEK